MPIAPSVRNVATGTGSLNAITPNMPTHQANDILIAVCHTANQDFPNSPAGWSLAPNVPAPGIGTAGAAGGVKLFVYWTRATSAAQTAPLFGDSGDYQYIRIMSVQDVITTGDPWDVGANNRQTANTTAVEYPTITTTVANTMIIWAGAWDRDEANTNIQGTLTNANTVNQTERMDNITTTGTGGGVTCVTAEANTARNIGTATTTVSPATFHQLWTGALKPIPDLLIRPFSFSVEF